jgi:transposase InsO family protein
MLEVLSHKVVQMPQPDRHELVQAPAPRRLDPPLQLCVAQEGEVASPTFVLRDNDSKLGGGFDAELAGQGIRAEKLPVQAPLCNAHMGRWIQSLRRECLNHFVPVGLRHLDHLISEYLEHYHLERPHQGLGNRLLGERQGAGHDPPRDEGEVVCRVRLGGVLRHYERQSAA